MTNSEEPIEDGVEKSEGEVTTNTLSSEVVDTLNPLSSEGEITTNPSSAFPTLKLGRSCALSLADDAPYVLCFASNESRNAVSDQKDAMHESESETTASTESSSPCVDTGENRTLIAAAVSGTHEIKLYHRDTFSPKGALKGHTQAITGILFDRNNPELLWSSGADGTLRLWNTEQPDDPSKVICQNKLGITAFDISCDGTVLAMAIEKEERSPLSEKVDKENATDDERESELVRIFFMDIGQMAKLAVFSQIHSDDVTQIKFHPTAPKLLLTASTDGLVAVLDLSNGYDEDDSVLDMTLNTETSVSSVGFFGDDSEYIYVLTHIETLQLWQYREGDVILKMGDLREKVPAECAIDYIVDCVYHQLSQRLFLVGGKHSGGLEIFHINLDQIEPFQSLRAGHSQTVRCLQRCNDGQLLTGGEDGMLCLWWDIRWSGGEEAAGKHASGGVKASKKQNKSGKKMHTSKPYKKKSKVT